MAVPILLTKGGPRWIAPTIAAASGAIVYLGTVFVLAARRHLWNDELYTYYIARQPHFGDVLHVLRTGLEPLPPFFYLVTRASTSTFGDGAVGIRMPELVGVLFACLCLFAAVARRSTAVYGLIAMLIPLLTQAYLYAPEARPYGLVLGFAAGAFLCWQLRTDRRGGLLPVAGLALCLALAAASHYYAILVLVPLALGESVRAVGRRRVDRPVIGAFALAFTPLIVGAPIAWDAHKLSSTFWAKPHLAYAVTFFGWLVRTPAVPPARVSEAEAATFVLAAVAVATWVLLAPLRPRALAGQRATDALLFSGGIAVAVALALSRRDLTPAVVAALAAGCVGAVRLALRRGARTPAMAASEIVAIAGFTLLPLLCTVTGSLASGAYVHRYALSAVIAPAVLLPLALHRLAGAQQRAALAVAGAVTLLFGVVVVYAYRDVSVDLRDQRADIALVRRLEQTYSLPVAVSHPQTALELSRYAPRAVNARMFNLAGPAAAQRLVGSSSTESAMLALRPLAPLDVEPLDSYLATNRPFILLWTPYFRNWILQALANRGRIVRRLGAELGWTIFLVPPRRNGNRQVAAG